MHYKTLRSICLLVAVSFFFSGCEILNELQKLKQAAQIKSGIAVIEGTDKSLTGAQKGGIVVEGKYKLSTAVKPGGKRYQDYVFPNIQKTTETYAKAAKQYNGQPKDLLMDIYMPKGDNVQGRPCVIFVFGGGWFMKTVDGMDDFGYNFARKGFVGVSIDYRIGFPKGTSMITCTEGFSGFDDAWYRAAQDAKAAIRYVKANADRLGIDKNKIFIGGHSAGGFTALNAVQLDDRDVPQDLIAAHGGVNAVGDHQNETTDVMGNYVLAAGALYSTEFIDKPVPTYLFMGTCDALLPTGTGKIFKCNKAAWPIAHTGPVLYKKYKSIGACVHHDVSCKGGHGFGGIGWEAISALASGFIYQTLIGNCKTAERAISVKSQKCQTANSPVCQ